MTRLKKKEKQADREKTLQSDIDGMLSDADKKKRSKKI